MLTRELATLPFYRLKTRRLLGVREPVKLLYAKNGKGFFSAWFQDVQRKKLYICFDDRYHPGDDGQVRPFLVGSSAESMRPLLVGGREEQLLHQMLLRWNRRTPLSEADRDKRQRAVIHALLDVLEDPDRRSR